MAMKRVAPVQGGGATATSDIYGDKGGRLNIFLKIAVLVYRHTILALDISVFLIKAFSEYIRQGSSERFN